jgi:hypothetical protein
MGVVYKAEDKRLQRGSAAICGRGSKACSGESWCGERGGTCVCHGGRYSASRVFGSRFRETFPARHSDAVALAASDSGAIGAGWRQKKPALALKALPAASPVEFGLKQSGSNISCLYPVYVHGQVYLAAGQGNAAAAEFQKILDHGGIVWNCWTGALAHLGVARANALQARTSQGGDADAARVRALAAYKDFLTLWKDADPDIPILKEAKAEFGKLQ